ncbi:MAG: alpha/beta fold hydrolase [Geminicoccaceae bacterium]
MAVAVIARLLVGTLVVGAFVAAHGRSRPERRGAGLSVRSPHLEPGALITRDACALAQTTWQPDRPPRALIVALHNFGDYRAGFDRQGKWFAHHGFLTMAYDQRGFGESATRGYWAGADTLVDDLCDAIEAMRARWPGLPLLVLGESMGGAVALAAAASVRCRPDGLMLVAPAVREGVVLRKLYDLVLRVFSHAMPHVTVDIGRGRKAYLDPSARERLMRDAKVLRDVRIDVYYGLAELANEASLGADHVGVPSLVLHGARDRLVTRASIDRLAERLGEGATLMRYPKRPHLLLHDLGAEQTFADMLRWIESENLAAGQPLLRAS